LTAKDAEQSVQAKGELRVPPDYVKSLTEKREVKGLI